jgi:hypothetical protein
MNDPAELAARYAAVWNEPDPAQRRAAIRELWSEDATHILQPPQEVLAAAAALDINPVFESRGHAELEGRVGRAYEDWVAPGELSFRPGGTAVRVGDAVRFDWEMVATGGEVRAVGLEFVLLAPDGRIRLDYQFIEP